MRFNVTPDASEELHTLRSWYQTNQDKPEVVAGFVWAVSLATGQDQAELIAWVTSHPAGSGPLLSRPGLDQLTVQGPVSLPEADEDYYGPGLSPVLRHAVEPRMVTPEDPFQAPRAHAVDLEGGGNVVQLSASFRDRADAVLAGQPLPEDVPLEVTEADETEVEALMGAAANPPSDV